MSVGTPDPGHPLYGAASRVLNLFLDSEEMELAVCSFRT